MTTPMIDDTGTEHFLDDEQIAAFFFEFTFAGTTRPPARSPMRSWACPGTRTSATSSWPTPRSSPTQEELVRWDTPSHYLRTTTEDVEVPRGTIPAGSTVAIVLASANHDERLYEEPELLDIHRKFDRKLWYGIGPHVCIGSALARAELRIALETIFRRLPDLCVDDAHPPGTPRASTGSRSCRR
jgi:cytochrome P450